MSLLTFVSFLLNLHLCFNAAFSLWDWYLSPRSASPSRCCGPCWVLTADRERWWAGHSLPGPSPDPCSWRRRPSPRCCNQTSCSSCRSWSRSTHLEKVKRKTMLKASDPLKLLRLVPVRNQFCLTSWSHTNLTENPQCDQQAAFTTWIFMGLEAFAVRVLLVPVEDASDEGWCQRYLSFCTGHSLSKRKQQRHVAVDPMFLLQLPVR